MVKSKVLIKTLKYLAVIIATLTVIILMVIAFFYFSFTPQCRNEIFQTYVSPNAKYKAVVFQRDCGATTGFSTQISLLKNGKKLPDEGGNVLIADGHPDDHSMQITGIHLKRDTR